MKNIYLKNIVKLSVRTFFVVMIIGISIKGLAQTNLTQTGFTSVYTPLYLSNGDINGRMPFMYRATVTGLNALTTYRYFTQAAEFADLGSANPGAGNPILISPSPLFNYKFSTNASLTSAADYETFTTDASGSYSGWFGFVNTSNARFTAGNVIYPTIVIGSSSGTLVARRALNVTATVLGFGTTSNATSCSFIQSTSGAVPKNFVMLFDNTAGTGRPLSIGIVQNVSVTIANIKSGYLITTGAWNAVIPNQNANGVRRLEQRAVSDGSLVACAETDADGVWPTGNINTVNPTTGTTAIVIATADNTFACALSNIIRSTTFTEPSNIAYSTYQTLNVTGGGTSDIKIGEFIIQDGGGSADADAFGTILNSITFTVANSANIRRLAIYDGATEVGTEQAGAGSVTFSGLTLTAADNGTKTFGVYASFNTAVTDNQQISLTVSAAAASAAGSSFAAGDAGAAATSTTTDRNRIEVTATRLVFGQGPTTTAILTNMTPAVTVSARDAVGFNYLDLDYATTVTLSITTAVCSSLTGNTATPSNGVATFASLQGTVAETGLSLTATSGSLTSATSSGTFDFTAASAALATIVGWNFVDLNAIADVAVTGNTTVSITTDATGTTTYPQGQLASPDKSITNDQWQAGNRSWSTSSFTTAGYSSITFSSVHRGSASGPRDFKVQYNLGSGWIDVAGATLSINSVETWPKASPAFEFTDFALPAACDNQPSVMVRWLQTSTVSVSGGTVASGGTNSIDEIYIKGNSISPASNMYYQTQSSGNFESVCIWQSSNSSSGPFTQASSVPDFTSQTINILNTHVVTLNSNRTLDQIDINAGGTFILNNFDLTINNGTGIDLVINGTFTDNASSFNGTNFNAGATWSMAGGASYIKTRNSSAVAFRDNYENGLSNIPSSANWILRYTGASDVTFTTVAGSTGSFPSPSIYPNLIFENSTGTTYTFITKFTGSSNYARVKGNLDIGGSTYSTGVTIANENTNPNPLLISGSLNIRQGSMLTNSGSSSGTGFEILGDVVVNGTFIVNNANSGLLKLSGSSLQTISGVNPVFPVSNMDIQNMTITNIAGVLNNKSNSIYGTYLIDANAKLSLGLGDIYLKSSAVNTANLAPLAGTISYPGTGRFIVERFISAQRKWRFLSVNTRLGSDMTPLTVQNSWMEGQTPGTHSSATNGYGMWVTDVAGNAGGFDSASFTPSIKWWNTATDNYTGITNPTTFDLRSQVAYMTFVRGDRNATGSNGLVNSTVIRQKGQLITGNYPAAGFETLIPAVSSITPVGNPYPATADLRQIFYDWPVGAGAPNINVMLWDPNLTGSQGLGGFQYITRIGNSGDFIIQTPGGGSYGSSTFINTLESGQAFFVQSNSGFDAHVRFTENSKTATANQVFFTGGQPQYAAGLLSIKQAGVNTTVDGFRVNFDAAYSNATDGNDAKKYSNTNENISVKKNNMLLAAEFRNVLNENDTIRINISNMRVADYTWKFDLINIDEPGKIAFLIDKMNGTETILNMNGSNMYDFNVINSPAYYAADRFMIVFRPAIVLPVKFTAISAARNADKTAKVTWKTANEINLQDYTVEFSADGSNFLPVLNQVPLANNGGNAFYSITDGHAGAGTGYFRIRANSSNGGHQYSAIAKIAPLDETREITVYPNPVKDNQLNIRFTNQPSGEYRLQVSNSMGQVLLQQTINITGVNTTQIIHLPKAAPGTYNAIVTDAAGQKKSISFLVQ